MANPILGQKCLALGTAPKILTVKWIKTGGALTLSRIDGTEHLSNPKILESPMIDRMSLYENIRYMRIFLNHSQQKTNRMWAGVLCSVTVFFSSGSIHFVIFTRLCLSSSGKDNHRYSLRKRQKTAFSRILC